MLKNFKAPIFASLAIMILFVVNSITVMKLIDQEDTSSNLFGILRFEEKVKKLFLDGKKLPNSLIYKYAIYDMNNKEIFTTLRKKPSSFKFVTLKENDMLFYKNFFYIDDVLFFIVISQEHSNKRSFFLAGLMLTLTLILVCFTIYLFYLASVKPYKDIQKYMNNFFNDAMHELKTPLGVAGINLEMLGIENKQTRRIKNALKQMQITYEDVEYYIKKGYIKFPDQKLNLSQYVLERTRFLLSLADSKHIKVVFDIKQDICVKMSKLALQRVIDNTITNAIKYSNKDSKIIIKLYKQLNLAIFSVEDFGCGIKDVEKIFQRYNREDSVQGGFGLGLNIVHEICLKYDIKYDVKTKLGFGSIFTYKFVCCMDEVTPLKSHNIVNDNL